MVGRGGGNIGLGVPEGGLLGWRWLQHASDQAPPEVQDRSQSGSGRDGGSLTGKYIPLSLISGGCQHPPPDVARHGAPGARRTAQLVFDGLFDLERPGASAVGAFRLVDDLSARGAAKGIADRHGANDNGEDRVWRGGVGLEGRLCTEL